MSSITFLGHFLRRPRAIGAVAPSSQGLVEQMLRPIDFREASVVVEYGPGTGVVTRLAMKRLREDGLFFAVEADEGFCRNLKSRIPELTVHHGSAAQVRSFLEEHGAKQADAIVSGLPWACFSEPLQDEILRETVAALPAGGKFVTFAYLQGLLLPSGIRFRRKLRQHFSRVESSPVVWSNFPPAFVYWCTK